MKTFSIVLMTTAMLSSASAFTPSSRPRTQSQRNVVDPEALQHLAQHGVDAARVVFLDCDNHECNMVEGTKMADGWMMQDKFGHHYETSAPGHTSKLLMMEMEDTE